MSVSMSMISVFPAHARDCSSSTISSIRSRVTVVCAEVSQEDDLYFTLCVIMG